LGVLVVVICVFKWCGGVLVVVLYKALESGAQILSTDYYTPDPTIGPFVIPFKGFIGD